MSLKINDTSIYKTAREICVQEVGSNRYAVWNRYAPSVVFMNRDGMKLLEFMKTNKMPYKEFKGVKRFLRKLIRKNILHEGQDYEYKNEFLEYGEDLIKNTKSYMDKHSENRWPYNELIIVNNACNLNCSYCIANKTINKKGKSCGATKEQKIERVIKLVDGFMSNPPKEQTGIKRRIHFNGGEFLLEFDVIKSAVDFILKNYPDEEIELTLNTNLTLVTDEIARWLAESKFGHIAVSIDGYRENHDKTRLYHNGSGSYDDVVRGMNLIKKHMKEQLDGFQGTLTADYDYDEEKIQEMKKHGFKKARLGMNLLGISPEKAKEAAKKHINMIMDSQEKDVPVSDDYIKLFHNAILEKDGHKKFFFTCVGFTGLAGKILVYNIDSNTYNFLCSYTDKIQVSAEEVGYDIYHPRIFQVSWEYLKERFETFKKVCADCELAALCRGGCILSGLDYENKENKSACAFKKEAWKHFVIHANEKKMQDN